MILVPIAIQHVIMSVAINVASAKENIAAGFAKNVILHVNIRVIVQQELLLGKGVEI